jgi:hypothetical protein
LGVHNSGIFKRPLENSRFRYKDNIKEYLKETGCDDVGLIPVADSCDSLGSVKGGEDLTDSAI